MMSLCEELESRYCVYDKNTDLSLCTVCYVIATHTTVAQAQAQHGGGQAAAMAWSKDDK